MIVGVVVSWITGFQDPNELDHDLLSPPIRSLLGTPTKVHNRNIQGIANLALELEDEKIRNENNKSTK